MRSGKGGSGDTVLNSSELGAALPQLAVFLFPLIHNGLAMGQYCLRARRENRKPAQIARTSHLFSP
jgi:hypothetical protein